MCFLDFSPDLRYQIVRAMLDEPRRTDVDRACAKIERHVLRMLQIYCKAMTPKPAQS